MPLLSVATSCLIGAILGAAARPLVFARSVPAPARSRSDCPNCTSKVLGPRWLFALPPSGRCPTCGERIGPPAGLVELLGAVAFAVIAVGGTSGWVAAAQYWLAACGTALTMIDLAVQRLPDVLTLPAAAGTLLLLAGAAVAGEPGGIGRAVAAAAVVTAVFLLLSLFAGMGLGDVKLAPAIGALLGWTSWETVVWGTAAGFAVGVVCAVALLLAGRGRREQVAYGPFMLIGALGISVLVS